MYTSTSLQQSESCTYALLTTPYSNPGCSQRWNRLETFKQREKWNIAFQPDEHWRLSGGHWRWHPLWICWLWMLVRVQAGWDVVTHVLETKFLQALTFTLRRVLLIFDADSGWSSRGRVYFTADSLLMRSNRATWPHMSSCFCSLWWSGSPATCFWCFWCWGLSPVFPDVSALPPWCQLSVSLWQCWMLPSHLTERQLLWLWIGPSLLHSSRLSV